MNVKYITSKGTELSLEGKFSIKSTDFHSYKWKVSAVSKKFGSRVNSIGKDPMEIPGVLVFTGGKEAAELALDSVRDYFEFDVANVSPGTLVIGDWYVKGFVISSSTSEYGENYIKNAVTLYCPYPFWIKEKKYSFYKAESGGSDAGLDFPFDFPFDLGSDMDYLSGNIENDLLLPAQFKMIVYGPIVNPMVTIGGQIYRVFTTVSANEYLVIDTREQQIYRVTRNGLRINEFNNRDKEHSIFEPIPSGNNSVIWNKTFGFDVTLYQERSEPKWN